MRITCPNCAAEYDVPGTLAPGRSVRCARCGTQWSPVPAPPPPSPPLDEPAAQPEPPLDEPAAQPEPPPPAPLRPLAAPRRALPPRPWPLIAAWVVSAALLAGLCAAAIVWRDPVMRAWPPSIRVYAFLGLIAPP